MNVFGMMLATTCLQPHKSRPGPINRIVNTYGARIPDSNNSQKHFRAAVILLVDQNHPADQGTLDRLSAEIQQFTHIGNEDGYTFNFWEATGGRATMAMGWIVNTPKGSGRETSYRLQGASCH